MRASFTDRYEGGRSLGSYAALNLGLGVGDDPEAVIENRKIAAAARGIDASRVVWMNQVHGRDVAVVTEPGNAGRVDAVVTTQRDLVLAAMAADCLPILAADAGAGVVGAAHAGRAGMLAGVASALVEEMVRNGADPAATVAVLGPAVCGGCYEVPDHMWREAVTVVAEAGCRTHRGSSGIDLRAAVTVQLQQAGIGQIRSDERCTFETPELFSHRRDAPTGRFAGYVWQSS
ncbi:peptidoglycan editing factor PgeF [Salinactinospora qingdaonensis]|uniref:Purine nucleoside phosphorylase n=1 Tax=Salinactinospora qingdaonensis TaxID=702744 RepID=A0ABP7FLW8_9ACTN